LCEKRGHGDILKSTCDALQVRLFLSKGIHARSFLVSIAEACAPLIKAGKKIRLGYVGDFDCSGLQMEIAAEHGNNKTGVAYREGLRQILARKHGIKKGLSWQRLGLTEKQFLKLPKKARVPVKIEHWDEEKQRMVRGDPNAPAYIAKYGKFGGEVEALGFERLQELVSDFIEESKEEKDEWLTCEAIERLENDRLASFGEQLQ
jgi:hypothetical protein